MIKELAQFTEMALADETFRNLGLTPKEGLHIVLKVEMTEGQARIAEKAEYAVYTKKTKELTPLHQRCASWLKKSWMVDTNKVFDNGARSIHTCSPYAFAFKKSSLEFNIRFSPLRQKIKNLDDPEEVGTFLKQLDRRKYDEDLVALEKEIKKNANKPDGIREATEKRGVIYDRVPRYFRICREKLKISNEYESYVNAFEEFLKNKTRIHSTMEAIPEYADLGDDEYIIFYLDLPLEIYEEAYKDYIESNIFNQREFNIETKVGEFYGTSNYNNTFNIDKPFLMHQSATFDISGRISSKEAQLLFEFSDMSRQKLFPNPLPVFVMQDELAKAAIKLFKDDAASGGEQRKGYLEIIEELWNDFKQDLGNYYLLFMVAGEIKDFDFVSRFEYNLSPDGQPWKVQDLFGTGEMSLETVKDLLTQVLPPLFNNALVVWRKEKAWIFRWFDDIDPTYCKTHSAYLMAMKYRKAFYDFIYKSKRQGVTGAAILDIVLTGIKDDIRLDEYKNRQHSERFNICQKLNLLFNLHQYFSTKPNPSIMPSTIIQLRDRIEAVAKGEAHIETDEQFAFAAGQVIARIFWESETGDESYRYLEPFLAQSKPERFKASISNLFKRYKHGVYSDRFRNVSSEVMTYGVEGDLRNLHPHILAGVFSNNLLFSDREKNTKVSVEVN